jgi:hypothetical protein
LLVGGVKSKGASPTNLAGIINPVIVGAMGVCVGVVGLSYLLQE